MCGRSAPSVVAFLVIPRGPVVSLAGSVEPGVQPVFRQLETVLHQEGGIGVVDEIFFRDAVVFERVADHSAQKRDIRSGTNLQEEV